MTCLNLQAEAFVKRVVRHFRKYDYSLSCLELDEKILLRLYAKYEATAGRQLA